MLSSEDLLMEVEVAFGDFSSSSDMAEENGFPSDHMVFQLVSADEEVEDGCSYRERDEKKDWKMQHKRKRKQAKHKRAKKKDEISMPLYMLQFDRI